MKRRNFVLGIGAASVGGSALLGSGAFSKVESQRSVTVQVAEDPNAYLGMDKCDTPNGSYVDIDDNGHLEVLMNPDNPTVGSSPLGEGVNSDSTTWADSVFQICNQGKEDACLWIEDSEDWPTVPEGEMDAGERRVDFYLEGDDETSIVGIDNAILLELGACVCIGIKTRTYGLSDGDELLSALDNEVTITADVTEVDGPGGTSLGPATARGEDPLAVQEVSTQSLGITDLTDPGLEPADLADALLDAGGSGIDVVDGSVTFVGEDVQGGTFGGGTGIVGFEDGILLSSGDVNDVVGPNEESNTTTNHGNPGDSDLDDLTSGSTLDAATLEFEFTVPEGTSTVGFNYVFGSEEYNEYVGSAFNDVFGFFLNGENVAVVDDPDGPGTIPAAINNINEGNGGSPTTEPTNPDLYINNDPFDPNFDGETVAPGDLLDTEMDGLTVVLDIEDAVNDAPGETNTLKLGVADTADRILDSWVLLEGGSFETDPPGPGPEPSPCGSS